MIEIYNCRGENILAAEPDVVDREEGKTTRVSYLILNEQNNLTW